MQLKQFRTRAAFTLVEIMIVVAIIGLLAAIAVPNLLRARERTQLSLIQNNLRLIDNAKQSWALENGQSSSAVPNEEQLAPYFNKSKFPSASVGETYNIGKVNESATANLPAGESLTGLTGPFDSEGDRGP
ncbi:MAG: type II secretion system protein [Verrucomicrobiota bacterium]|nr:type II secretion system protein [Verrucomicrobiota bacterium]